MQDDILFSQARPFAKLAQSNMNLLTQFSASPEVSSLATANATQWLQQASDSAMNLMQSGAFAHVMQGMLQNYTEFLTELSQGWMGAMRQGHETLVSQAQEAVEAVKVPARRGRQSA
jgi:hypothetical protein